jgi:hypothetical protein
MKLELKKFGATLSSRPSAKEAWLSTQAYVLSELKPNEKIEVDFAGVDVLTPSWADEFISSLKSAYPNRVVLLPSKNRSVKMSLEFLS